MAIRFSVRLGSGPWPNGTPIHSEGLADGRVRHTLEDGSIFTVPAEPTYTLHYQSKRFGAKPGDHYEIPISIAGWCPYAKGFVACWNYAKGARRSYSIDKILRIASPDGTTFAADDLRAVLGDPP